MLAIILKDISIMNPQNHQAKLHVKSINTHTIDGIQTIISSLLLAMLLTILLSSQSLATNELKISLDQVQTSGEMGSKIIQLLGAITILSLAPSIIMMMTSFTKIIIVFSILRNALGLQQSPPNTIIISLSIFLTFFIMQPTLQISYEEGLAPMINKEIAEEDAWPKIIAPFKQFMSHNVAEKEINLFAQIAKIEIDKNDIPMPILIPSFMLSEIKKGFEIGFLLFLPFIIIDILTASILMSMGMMMLPPSMISLPIKLIFFVLVDGWHMLCGSLVKSYF